MKTHFFVTTRALGPGNHQAVSAVIKAESREILEKRIMSKSPDIEIITIIAVCQINEMCK